MTALILSPHLDDAVLSCWHLLDGASEVDVVNVFAGVPPADAAGWWDHAGGIRSSSQAVQQRRSEDQAALALARRGATNLDFLDDQYRQGPQPTEPLVERLRALLAPQTTLLAPAALAAPCVPDERPVHGPHPDHVAVRSAALALHGEGCAVLLYADLPHASAGGLPAWVTGHSDGVGALVAERWRRCMADAQLDVGEPEVHRLSGRALARKLEAVRRYDSQLAPLERGFGQPLDTPELLDHEIVWSLT